MSWAFPPQLMTGSLAGKHDTVVTSLLTTRASSASQVFQVFFSFNLQATQKSVHWIHGDVLLVLLCKRAEARQGRGHEG